MPTKPLRPELAMAAEVTKRAGPYGTQRLNGQYEFVYEVPSIYRIAGFFGLFHRPVLLRLENTTCG
jgi:hypothetical protein